jgi:hypothetical protein
MFLRVYELHYLGHLITRFGVKVDPKKTEAIDLYPAPTSKTELHSFLGLCSYYRRFVRNYSAIAAPLYDLLAKDAEFIWLQIQSDAFRQLKQNLVSAPILMHPNFAKPFLVQCDASYIAIGAVLSQKDDRNREHPISFFNKKLTKAEKRWSIHELEFYSVLQALKKWRAYLIGTPFTVETDHVSLKWMRETKDNAKLLRWALQLEDFDFKVVHRSGKANANADALSRITIPDSISESSTGTNLTLLLDEAISEPSRSRPQHGGHGCYPQQIYQQACFRETTGAKSDKLESKSDKTQDHDNNSSVANLTLDESKENNSFTCLLISEIELPSRESLREMQASDPEFSDLVARLRAGRATSKDSNFSLHPQSGLLMYHSRAHEPRIVAPPLIRTHLIRIFHEIPISGHLGRDKTHERLAKRFFWHRMTEDIRNFIRGCLSCALRKTPVSTSSGELQTYQATYPFEILHIDLIGPFDVTPRGNKYVFIAIDRFTHWPELVPLQVATAESCADALVDRIISRHACPDKIISDRGSQFISKLFRRLSRRLGVKNLYTTAYHPQSNARCERANSWVERCIAIFIRETRLAWDDHLPGMELAYRTSLIHGLGFSPFALVYGREPTLPTDVLYGSRKAEEIDVSQYHLRTTARLRRSYQLALENQTSSDAQVKTRYDAKQKPVTYQPGDEVILYTPQFRKGSRKLQMQNRGPFTVLRHSSPVNVHIRHNQTGKLQHVHVQRLARFHPRSKAEPTVVLEEVDTRDTSETPSSSSFSSSSVSGSPATQPEVSPVVLNRRMGENGNEFLVRTGDIEEWKTAENTPLELVRAFNSRARTQRALRARQIVKNL